MKKRILTVGFVCILVLFAVTFSPAQESDSDLAKAAANPLAAMMSFPFQNNTDVGLGEYNRTRNILNIQPVIPLAGGKIITRTIFPVVWLPDVSAESGTYSSGLADTLFTAFYVQPAKGNLTWGPGLAVEIPTGGEKRGAQKWSLGPSVVALTQPGGWTLGILANNVWSIGGNSDRASVNKGLLQYFIVYTFPSGWYVNSAPTITVNWNAPDGQKWTVPFGVGIGKIVRLGKLPVNLQLGAYVYAVKPDIAPDWQFRFQAQFIIPMSMLKGN
jgi:hypothetical protein